MQLAESGKPVESAKPSTRLSPEEFEEFGRSLDEAIDRGLSEAAREAKEREAARAKADAEK